MALIVFGYTIDEYILVSLDAHLVELFAGFNLELKYGLQLKI